MTEPSPDDQQPATSDVNLRPARWVAAAFLGGAHTKPSSLRISQPSVGNDLTFTSVNFAGRSFDSPLYYGFRVGHTLPRSRTLAAEVEFIHLKVFSDPAQRVRATGSRSGERIDRELQLGELVQQYSISHGVNLLLFNLAGRYRIGQDTNHPQGRLILTGRAGAGPTVPHTESRIEARQQEQYELGTVGWQVAGGGEINLWGSLYALGEYKFTRTRQKGKIYSGKAASLLQSHHLVFGLSYHF